MAMAGELGMKAHVLVGLGLLVGAATASAAGKCRSLDVAKLNKAIPLTSPWKVEGGGSEACSFDAGSTNSFGFSQTVDVSSDKADASVRESKQAIAADNRVNDESNLGTNGFSYSVKLPSGQANEKSVFLFGHRGRIEINGYLNLQKPVTQAQREAAAKLMFDSMAIAEDSKALAAATKCPYFDNALVERLFSSTDLSVSVPSPGNCTASVDGNALSIGVASGMNSDQAVSNMLKNSGCKVDALPRLGKPSGIAYACSGNPRAQILFIAKGKMFDLSFVSPQEPTSEQRATLIALAEYAARQK
jgi:hypothetical protein